MNSTHLVIGGNTTAAGFKELLERLEESPRNWDVTIQEGLFVAKPAPPIDSELTQWLVEQSLPFVREVRDDSGYRPTHVYQPRYQDEPQAVSEDLSVPPETLDSLSSRLKTQLKEALKDSLPEESNGIWDTLRNRIENIDEIIAEAIGMSDVEEELPPLTVDGQPVTRRMLSDRRRTKKRETNQKTR